MKNNQRRTKEITPISWHNYIIPRKVLTFMSSFLKKLFVFFLLLESIILKLTINRIIINSVGGIRE